MKDDTNTLFFTDFELKLKDCCMIIVLFFIIELFYCNFVGQVSMKKSDTLVKKNILLSSITK